MQNHCFSSLFLIMILEIRQFKFVRQYAGNRLNCKIVSPDCLTLGSTVRVPTVLLLQARAVQKVQLQYASLLKAEAKKSCISLFPTKKPKAGSWLYCSCASCKPKKAVFFSFFIQLKPHTLLCSGLIGLPVTI